MRTPIVILSLLFALFTARAENQNLPQNIIEINTDFVLQNSYYGGAMQWEPNDRDAMTEAQWERLFSRVRYMKLGYIRCCIMPYFYCFGFNGNTPKMVWNTDPKTVNAEWYSNSSRYIKDLYRFLDFCQKENIDVLLGEWWRPNSKECKQAVPVKLPKYSIELDDPLYAEQVAQMVNHLVKDKGFTCIKQFNFGNEVNLLAGVPGLNYTWEKWKKSIQNLDANFKRDGLGYIKIVGPDGGYWGEDTWFNKTLEQLDKEVSVIDYHWYMDKDWTLTNRVEDETRMFRFFTQLNNKDKKNIWGEMGIRDGHNDKFDQQTQLHSFWYGTFVADGLIQTLRSGWSSGNAWGMDDAMHYFEDTDNQKIWGFWNSIAEQKGKPEEAAIRPWFYTWSLLSRNFPKGSQIVYSNSFRTQHLNCVAAKTPDGNISFAITNTADFQQSVTLQIPTIENKQNINKYVYFENDRPVDSNGFPVVKEVIKKADLKKGIRVDFPASGFILLTTIGAEKPVIKSNDKQLVDPMEGLQLMFDYSKNLGINGFSKHPDACGSTSPAWNFSRIKYDYGTIHPATNTETAYITYKFDGLTDFKIAVSGTEKIEGRFKVFASADNKTWSEIEFSYPTPELTIWRWFHTTLSPKTKLSGFNYLKIEMNPNGWFDSSRVREVRIMK